MLSEKLRTIAPYIEIAPEELSQMSLEVLRNAMAMLDAERSALQQLEKQITDTIAEKELAAQAARGPNPKGIRKIG